MKIKLSDLEQLGIPFEIQGGSQKKTAADRGRPEEEFQKEVLKYAKDRGWLRAHFRPAKTDRGWRTAVSGDGAGFPDLVLVRDRVVWIELKSHAGKVSHAQQIWIDALINAKQEVYVFRPADMNKIIEVLQ